MGYRNREDITNLPPGVLIVGSQNVLTNVSERIEARKGYTLDGASSVLDAATSFAFDWSNKQEAAIHMRAGGLTSAANDGVLQYRFVDSDGDVEWRDLIDSLTSVSYNASTYWDTTEGLRVVLFVNGASEVNEWNGAITTFASDTGSTITKEGTTTWAQAGFYQTANKKIILNDVEYTYTGGETTTTLTGVTPDPTLTTNNAGDVIHQSVVTTPNTSLVSGPGSTYATDLISTLNNQVYLGSLTDSQLFKSQINAYKDFSSSSPRIVGDGELFILDANAVALVPQENTMYVSAGDAFWYEIEFQLSADLVNESVTIKPLKTTSQQGAQSQALVGKMKNNIIFISGEPTLDELGRVLDIAVTPQQSNISDSIKIDFDGYDFANGSVFYHQYFIYVAVPAEGLVRIFNISTQAWEAPQTIPIARFSIIDGDLYGHSSLTLETYKLFDGFSDNGSPIPSKVVFSYQNYGDRVLKKRANEFFIEGYINANTTMTAQTLFEIDGCETMRTFTVGGTDKNVCVNTDDNSLGKNSLGKQPLGSSIDESLTGLPPKFRVIKTFDSGNFFEVSFSFEILGEDQRFELLAYGLNVTEATDDPVEIKDEGIVV